MSVPITFSDGNLLTGAQLNLIVPTYVVLSSNQVYTNTTTPASVTDITFTMLPNVIYAVELHAGATSSATAHGVGLNWTTTGTVALSTGLRRGNGPATTGTTQSTSTVMHSYLFNALSVVTYGTDTAAIGSGVAGIDEYLTVTGGASGGTLTLQAAQATLGAATTTTLLAGTWALARAVG